MTRGFLRYSLGAALSVALALPAFADGSSGARPPASAGGAPGGASGDYQKNASGVLTGKTPGAGVDAAFGNGVNGTNGFLTYNFLASGWPTALQAPLGSGWAAALAATYASGGGGGGVTSITPICPASGTATGAVTLNGSIVATSRSPVTGSSDAILNADCSGITNYTYSGNVPVSVPSVPADGALAAGWYEDVATGPNTTLTLTGAAGATFFNNGGSTMTVAAGTSARIRYMGSNIFEVLAMSGTGGGSSSLASGSTAITGGSAGNVLTDNGGTLTEQASSGSGNIVRVTSPALVTPALGTPSSANLANATGYPFPNLAGAGSGVLAAAVNATNAGGGFPTLYGAFTNGHMLVWDSAHSGFADGGAPASGGSTVPGTAGQVPTADGAGGFATSFSIASSAKTALANAVDSSGGLVTQKSAIPLNPFAPPMTPNLFYPLYRNIPQPGGASGGITASTEGYFAPFFVDSKQTWSEMDGRTSAAGTSTCTFAVYGNGNNSTTSQNQPNGAPIATVTTPIANTGAGVQWDFTANSSLSGNLSFLSPGMYWLGMQCADTTIKFYVPPTGATALVALMGGTVSTSANGISTMNLNLTGMTYGTWPTFTSSQAFGSQTSAYAPAADFKFVSYP